MSRRFGLAVTTGLLAAWLLPAAAVANMAPPVQPGDALGEPAGALADVHIEHEQLALDLRPLADAAPVEVDATYRVRNDGASRQVELVFVAAGLDGEAHGVWLDGQRVPFETEAVSSQQRPADIPWQPPSSTPGLGGGTLSYSARYEGLVRFTLDLAPGSHEIRVSYPATATAVSGDGPARYWQLGYVLSPARQWASFGTLDVSVQLPPGWSFASSPALTRDGDEAHASFDDVPADALAITAQFPYTVAPAISLPLIGIVVGLGALLAVLLGLLFARRGWRGRRAWPISLVYAIGAAFLAIFMGRSIMGGSTDIPSSQASWNAYQGIFNAVGEGLQMLIFMPLLAVVLFLLMQAIIAFLARRASQAQPPSPLRAA